MKRLIFVLFVALFLCPLPLYASSSPSSFSFVVFGDSEGGATIFNDLITRINREPNVAFCVGLGDFVSSASEQSYKKYLSMTSKLKPKLYQVIGNHDVYKGGYAFFNQFFGDSYYSFNYGNSHFVVLDNALSKSFDAKQFAWLKADLANSAIENIFVFMHKPIFDPTELYAGTTFSAKKTTEELLDVFKRYQVKYVFTGHVHGYIRTVRDGTVYVGTGGGGSPLHLPREFGGFYHCVRINVRGSNISDNILMLYE